MRRTLFLLALAALFALGGCKLKPLTDHLSTTAVSTTAATTSPSPSWGGESEPVYDCSGRTWTLRAPWADKLSSPADTASADELAGIVSEVELKFNCRISLISTVGTEDYLPASASGSTDTDVVGVRACEIPSLAGGRFIYSVADPMLINAGLNRSDKTRWNGTFASKCVWDSKQWTVQIGSKYNLPSFGSFLLYNHYQLWELGAGNILNLAETCKWTTDVYLELASAASENTDRFGNPRAYGTGVLSKYSAFIAFGGQLVSLDGSGFSNEAASVSSVKAISALQELLLRSSGAASGDKSELISLFTEGRLAFLWIDSQALLDNPSLTAASGGCSVMPLPSDSGESSSLLSGYEGYTLLTSNTELAKSVAVFNALALRMHGDWLAEYFAETGLSESNRDVIEKYIAPYAVIPATEYARELSSVADSLVFSSPSGAAEEVARAAAAELDTILASLSVEDED